MVIGQRRLGKFSISLEVMQNNWESITKLFSFVVVLDARYDFCRNAIDYIGVCSKFDGVEEGMEAPKYDLNLVETVGSNGKIHIDIEAMRVT